MDAARPLMPGSVPGPASGPVPRRIGLTGGIGSGKSEVARVLVGAGALLVDTDAIAHRLTTAGGAAIAPLVQAFGPGMLDATGAMDRARMRQRAFEDPTVRHRLQAVLHPLIASEAQAEAAQAAPGQPVVFDVPLLAESGTWRDRVDRVLVVDCSEATQVARVMRRSGWSRALAESVVAQQASRNTRLAIADAVILNDAIDLHRLRERVLQVWHDWGLGPQGASDGRDIV